MTEFARFRCVLELVVEFVIDDALFVQPDTACFICAMVHHLARMTWLVADAMGTHLLQSPSVNNLDSQVIVAYRQSVIQDIVRLSPEETSLQSRICKVKFLPLYNRCKTNT